MSMLHHDDLLGRQHRVPEQQHAKTRITTLDCNTSTAGLQTNCPVACGDTRTVRLGTTEPAGLGPFSFTLHVPGQPDQTFTGPGPCHDVNVGPITATTTITGDVTSAVGNCTKSASASVTLTTTLITVNLAAFGGGQCATRQPHLHRVNRTDRVHVQLLCR